MRVQSAICTVLNLQTSLSTTSVMISEQDSFKLDNEDRQVE